MSGIYQDIARIPPAPREPTQKGKDVVFKYQGAQKILLILGAAFLFGGSLFVLIFMWNMPFDWYLDINPSISTGIIEKKETNYHISQNGEHPVEISYQYEVSGITYTAMSITYDYDWADELSAGSELSIEYIEEWPEISRIEDMQLSAFSYWVSFVLMFPLIGAILLPKSILSNRREKKAYISGTPIIADITSAGWDYNTSSNGKHPFQIKYAFSVQGMKYTGDISHMDDQVLKSLMKEGKIAVVYLENKPSINVIYI